MLKLKLNKNSKYILTCSFGPDSMCLFDLLLKGKFDFVVAHVNFHLRKEEQSEVATLSKLCKDAKIKLFIKDFYMPKGANEEGWARKVRYDYFSELSGTLNIENVLVAHNEDDLLETYILQKRRGNLVSFYGLKTKSEYKKCTIIRPLLEYQKSELLDYCNINKVPYGLDLSNFDTTYTRNKIRKNIVKDMVRSDRNTLLEEINQRNSELATLNLKFKPLYSSKKINVTDLNKLSPEECQFVLIQYFENRGYYHPISKGFIKEFLVLLERNKNWHRKLEDNIYLSIDYGELGLYFINENAYDIDFINENVIINKSSKIFGDSDLKNAVIKNRLESKTIYVEKSFKKKVGRCFIDWKMPYVYRLIWPGVFSEQGELIYLPHYQKNYQKTDKVSALEFTLSKFVL